MSSIKRLLDLRKAVEKKSLFLLGPRQTGKSTLLKAVFPTAPYYNLLHTDVFFRLQQEPFRLRQEILALPALQEPVIIDEIQKLPIILDEVQALIDQGVRFVLTGSSARKLKTGSINLLGGRARLRNLHPFVSAELADFSVGRAIERGLLPSIWYSDEPEEDLRAYCGLYLKEEILAESIVRRLEGFSRFLAVAGISNGRELNFENIARDCAVPARTVREYVAVLSDTLIATLLEPWKQGGQRKPVSRAKLYFFDLAVARVLAGRPAPAEHTAEWGDSFEQLIFQELRAWLSYRADTRQLSYWRTYDNREVDFVVGNELAIEVKAARKVQERDLKGLRDIAAEGSWRARLLVCREAVARLTDDGILILPVEDFLARLWGDAWA